MDFNERDQVVADLTEIALNNAAISGYCIEIANRATGRTCDDNEDLMDDQWWTVHNLALSQLFQSASQVLKR